MTNKNNITSLAIMGTITATSNKQDGQFKQDVPTKTIYLKVEEPYAQQLKDFGLTEYTNDQDKWFIVGIVREPMIYKPNGLGVRDKTLSHINGTDGENPNYQTSEPIGLNIIKGHYLGNDFFKLQAIRLEHDEQLIEVQPENPFGDLPAF